VRQLGASSGRHGMYAAKTGSDGRLTSDGSYHQCWYPIAESAEVAPGQIVGRDVLGGRVMIVRDRDGAPRGRSGRGRHLGADLASGDLIDGQVRCPFHHWHYDADGRCSFVPATARAPERARLFSYPAAEQWDLIWMFNGPVALYPVPGFPD